MKEKMRKLIAAMLCLSLLVIAACGTYNDSDDSSEDSTSEDEAESTDDGGEAEGNDAVIVVGMDSDLATLDPGQGYEVYGNLVYYALYDNLFKVYEDSTPVPCLAEEYEISEDGTVYTIKIKEGVKFSSGNDLTSEDVRFSFMRTKYIKGNASYHAEAIVDIETPDDYTVIITLEEPDAAFLVKLAYNAFAILDSEVVKEHGGTDQEDAATTDTAEEWLNQNSAGSGAYVLDSWNQNVEVIMSVNENYWGEVKNGGVYLKEIPDVNTQIQMLQAGDIDVALSVSVDNVSQLEGVDGVEMYNVAGTTITFLLMNEDPDIGGPVADSRVQEAIRLALNYEELLELSGEGAVLPLNIVPAGFTGALEKDASTYQDVDRAKELLAEAGYEDGFSVKFTVASYDTEGMSWTTLAQKIASDLAEVGIEAEIETGEIGTVIESYRNGEEQLLLMHWHPDYPEVSNQLAFLPGETVGDRANWGEDALTDEMAELMDIINTSSDESEREAASEELQELLDEDMPYAFLVQHPKVVAYNSQLQGIHYYEMQKLNLQDLSLSE